jgi:predicted acylesterase/phospholipase RssA
MLPPKRIAMSGGGMKGIAHIGVLEVLEKEGLLKRVKEYIGTSVGALISFALCIGYTLSELHTLCIALDFSLTQNIDPDNIFKCMETYGFDDGVNIEKLLIILLKAKRLQPTITFEELDALLPDRPALRVFAVNLKTCTIQEFSFEKTPRVQVKWAVQASMTIPIYFTPMKDLSSNELYVDGGLIAQFPFHHLSSEERLDTLGLAFKRGDSNIDITKLEQYILKLYYSVNHHQTTELYKAWGNRIIQIDCADFPSFYFGADPDEKSILIESGVEAARNYLDDHKWIVGKAPARRYSLP